MTRYELLDRIGVGGMAEIFRGKAVAAGGFEKPVAIKRILPHLSQDQRFVELLIAEAKVLSLLKHRNITQIFDVGLGDDGQYFLVMEFVDGKDLGAVVRALEAHRRRIPFDLALHIIAEICEALEHAHTARAPDGKPMSLVHRDISPSNVLLSRAGEVKLTDFGIAKRAEQEQTKGGAVKGKFAYISPEQARNEPLDPRSDVFAVGILLWELTTNRALFSKLPDLEALRGVREPQSIPPPSRIDPKIKSARELDALVMSALAPLAAKRPTAGQLGQKLRGLRYALDEGDTVGDPASELARLIEAAEQEARASVTAIRRDRPASQVDSGVGAFEDFGESTVIRIHTADAFAMRDPDGTGMAQARMVIDRFEEEETRLASLSADQMRVLRGDGGGRRSKRDTAGDEPTQARAPLSFDDGDEATFAATPSTLHALAGASGRREDSGLSGAGGRREDSGDDLEVPRSRDSDEHTRLIAPRDRRTPRPEVPQRNAPVPRPPVVAPAPTKRLTASKPSLRPAGGPPPIPLGAPPPAPVSSSLAPPSAPASSSPNAGAWQAQHPPGHDAPPSSSLGAPNAAHRRPGGAAPGAYATPESSPAYATPMPFQAPVGVPTAAPSWARAASPTVQDLPGTVTAARPRPSNGPPPVAGFAPKPGGVKPWMFVVGALIVAGLAFAITRGLLGSAPAPTAPAPAAGK